jgi:hypothetical protein
MAFPLSRSRTQRKARNHEQESARERTAREQSRISATARLMPYVSASDTRSPCSPIRGEQSRGTEMYALYVRNHLTLSMFHSRLEAVQYALRLEANGIIARGKWNVIRV